MVPYIGRHSVLKALDWDCESPLTFQIKIIIVILLKRTHHMHNV